jgi:predicted AAA+ superfamily ATPase
MSEIEPLLAAAESLIARLDRVIPAAPAEPEWEGATAFRWRGLQHPRCLQAITRPHAPALADMQCIERQKSELVRNTRQFLQGLSCNNVLLWGSRGTGKSSLIKALLKEYSDAGLKLIEVDKHDLIDLPDILDQLEGRDGHCILFCDDLSFTADEPSYKTLKAVLDGSLSALPDNMLIYATSNRRHLLPEFSEENLQAGHHEGEIHPAESVEERISLSDRFGLWLAFHPFSQDEYLQVVRYWLEKLGSPSAGWEPIRKEALRWALRRGSRSGRTAWQFARDWSGKTQLEKAL